MFFSSKSNGFGNAADLCALRMVQSRIRCIKEVNRNSNSGLSVSPAQAMAHVAREMLKKELCQLMKAQRLRRLTSLVCKSLWISLT